MQADEKPELTEEQTELSPEDATPSASEDQVPELERAADYDQVLEDAMDLEASSQPEPTVDERVAQADREVLRAKAELENYRKRMQRESELQLKYAHMPLIRDLLEVVDNLQRAIEAAGEDGASIDALRKGVDMVNQQLANTLGKFGCKPVAALGVEFDPNVHEAIAQMPSEEYQSGSVMQEVAIGYLLHDRVVRPSQVIVSTGGDS